MLGFKKSKVPDWATIMEEKEYKLFMAAVENYFKQKGEYTVEDGFIHTGDGMDYGLSNLMQLCAGNDPDSYPSIVSGHFDLMAQAKLFDEEFRLIADNFDEVKKYIGVRLYDEEYVRVIGGGAFISRPFAGEVFSALVYDFPHVIQSMSEEDTVKWGRTEDELFSIGIENIRRKYSLEYEKVDMGGDHVFAVETEHFYAPNILFELEQHKEFIGVGGALVAIPTRSMAMIYPIRDTNVVNMLTRFIDMVPRFFSGGPGSLTTEIYWYHKGQYEPLSYVSGKKPSFTPSDAFIEMLNTLS